MEAETVMHGMGTRLAPLFSVKVIFFDLEGVGVACRVRFCDFYVGYYFLSHNILHLF